MGSPAVIGQVRVVERVDEEATAAFLLDLESKLPGLQHELLAAAKPDGVERAGAQPPSLVELAQRVRLLATQAAQHRQSRVAEHLTTLESIVRAGSLLGAVRRTDAAEVERTVARIAEQIRAERERDTTPVSGPVRVVSELDAPASERRSAPPAASTWHSTVPPVVLVVAPEAVAAWLRAAPRASKAPATVEDGMLEVEQTDDLRGAVELARAMAPDVVVVDVDRPEAAAVVDALSAGPLVGAAPVVAMGTWANSEQAAGWLAAGVARCIAKPVSPAALRRACWELAASPAAVGFEPLGSTSVDALTARLSEELHRGLRGAADNDMLARSVDLGQGADVLAALWGAVARIRELVTAKSDGRVRFVPTGPEGALPVASWLTSTATRAQGTPARSAADARRGAEPCSLAGRTIVVADDDLSVNWFLVRVLRDAGALVLDARNGAQALALAYRHSPDLVISDIVMPELDGFALCRALKRDVVLRDVPVLLLSWKDDLLQRVRELGVGAEGYLRKEASGAVVVRRVAELLQARAQLSARLAHGGIVRGRLDGLTAYSLLLFVSRLRPDSRLSIRDATYLYELELRRGHPVRATRTAGSGEGEEGPAVLRSLLGVAEGRFGVEPSSEEVAVQLRGTLGDQLRVPLAAARAAQTLLAGPALRAVERLELDPSWARRLAEAAPAQGRELLQALASGASPRELLDTGRVSGQLLENVLSDAVRHGAVRAALDAQGDDLLAPAVARELSVLTGQADGATMRASLEAVVRAASLFVASPTDSAGRADPVASVVVSATEPANEPRLSSDDLAHILTAAEAHDATPMHGTAEAEATAGATDDVVAELAPPPRMAVRLPGHGIPRSAYTPLLTTALPVTAVRGREPASGPEAPANAVCSAPAPSGAAGRAPEPLLPAVPMPSAYAPTARRSRKGRARPKSRARRLALPILFGVVGVGLAVGARWMREHHNAAPQAIEPARPTPAVVAPTAAPETSEPAPSAAPDAPRPEATAAPGAAEALTEVALGPDEQVAPGEGVLEIVAGKSDEITVNGKALGTGPVVKVTLKAVPDPYEIRVKLRGEERVRYAVVKEGKRVRMRVAPPWTR